MTSQVAQNVLLGFLDQLAHHVSGETDAVTAVVEGLAFAIENLSKDDRIGFMLSKRSSGEVAPSLTADTALAFSRSMLHRYEVDWEANGFDEDALSELAEFLLRILYSYLVDSNPAPRDGTNRRARLRAATHPAPFGVMTPASTPVQSGTTKRGLSLRRG